MSFYRKCAVRGSFYPREKDKTLSLLMSYFPLESPSNKANNRKKLFAIVGPHAGLMYCGNQLARAYQIVSVPDTVVILCPNHTGVGESISVWAQGKWETPLGDIDVNESLAKDFLDHLDEASKDINAHLKEHAIEVHLPFLKWIQSNVKIVPIVMKHLSLEMCLKVGKVLSNICSPNTLLVASTDMSHYVSANEAKKSDSHAIRAVESIDPILLYEVVHEKEISMCGVIPTVCVLEAARLKNIKTSRLVAYGNSGEVNQSFQSVVSYASFEIP